MPRNQFSTATACGLKSLAVTAVLASAPLAGNAQASPILGVRATDTAWAAVTPAPSARGSLPAPAQSAVQGSAGMAHAVSETLHAMAMGTLYGEPSFRLSAPVPDAPAPPSRVAEPATAGLLAAGVLAMLGMCRRKRPAGIAV